MRFKLFFRIIDSIKRIDPLLSLLLLILVFASCKKNDPVTKPVKGMDLLLNSVGLQKAAADNAFTFNLFKTVASASAGNSNVFISPLSVGFALGMTSNGANGATLASIKKVMNDDGFTQDQINAYYDQLLTDLPQLDPNTTIKIANSIWYRQDFSVLPQFLQTNSSFYHANVQSLDFNLPSSAITINNWVNSQTNGKIPQIIDQVTPDDMMYLINAIYFKSAWNTRFDPTKTTKMPFILGDNSQVETDFMEASAVVCNSFANDSLTMLELPYSNKKYSMVIAIPGNGISLNNLVASLNSDSWQNWIAMLNATTIDVIMPKFQFSYSVKLNNALSELGMGVAFSKDADFTGINPSGNLQITSVNHKAFIAVDEAGTEAAAATSVTVGPTLVLNHQVIINHPFVFVIREMKTGLILFTGIMNNPLQN